MECVQSMRVSWRLAKRSATESARSRNGTACGGGRVGGGGGADARHALRARVLARASGAITNRAAGRRHRRARVADARRGLRLVRRAVRNAGEVCDRAPVLVARDARELLVLLEQSRERLALLAQAAAHRLLEALLRHQQALLRRRPVQLSATVCASPRCYRHSKRKLNC